MENGQPTKTESESEKRADTLGASTSWQGSENTGGEELKNSPTPTTATMPSASKKTWKSAELEVLLSKVGLVAGALADFQSAGGMILTSELAYTIPSGRTYKAVKLLLFVDGADLVVAKTDDGLDFNLVAGGNMPVSRKENEE